MNCGPLRSTEDATLNETVEQYVARLTAFVADADPLAVIESTPAHLAEAVRQLPESLLDYKSAPNRWSIRQQAAHLADAELIMTARMRWAAAEPGKRIAGFDQDRWAARVRYDTMPVALSIATFSAIRGWTVEFIKRLTPDERAAAYIEHEERGRETFDRLLTLMAGHDLNHLDQIAKLRKMRE